MPAAKQELVSLDDIIEEWAMDMFKRTANKKQQKIPKDCLMKTISYKRVKFDHVEPKYEDERRVAKPMSQVLFKSHFTNNTEQDQEYSFKTERTTRSTCEVEYEEGYTVGQEVSVTLKTPGEVFEANAGFHRELSLMKTEGETKEEELNWAVDSQIRVPPKHETVAELVISEEQYAAQFTIETTIRGTVHVVFTNLSDNNSFVKSVDSNIVDIFRKKISEGRLKSFNIDGNCIRSQFKGLCKFRYGIEQHVKLSEAALNNRH
ncbi:uncharacterized protein LOC135488143 isoform X2 [Lineus longissimus]